MNTHRKLQANERDKIALWLARKTSKREIARRLGRSPSSVCSEINGNLIEGEYVACYAQNRAKERKERSHQRCPLKSKKVYAYVYSHLRQGWSPEQIAGRMTLENESDPSMRIVHETIYRYIYGKDQKDKILWEYLPRKKKKRSKWQGRSVHRGHIPQRVSIHERPIAINERLEKGHWESDTVEGKGHQDGIHTEVERLSRYFMATKLLSISSAATISVQWQLFNTLPSSMRRTMTLDNGKENHLHYLLNEIGMRTYFCDPYSSWQKGCVENHNGLLRRYIPKKTDIATISEQELQDIVDEINHRPRKVLGYRTPYEVFTALLLSEEPFVPIQSIQCSDPS